MDYIELVNKRKLYPVTYNGFINQSQIEKGIFDTGSYLEPWGQWHNAVPTDILLVGQDWSGQDYYIKNEGKDIGTNFTCSNLIKLCTQAGFDIGTPQKPFSDLKLHFANVIPFIRKGEMAGNKNNIINDGIIKDCSIEFLKPLIDIVSPKIIITLGSCAYKGVRYAFDLPADKSFTIAVDNAPIAIEPDIKIFPMFHCGAMGVNRNRKLPKQSEDWSKLIPYVKNLTIESI